MDLNKIVNNIKNSKIFQYLLAASVFVIIIYSGLMLFLSGKRNVSAKNVANNAVINFRPKTNPSNQPGVSYNQKRILQEMEIDYNQSKNPNALYISSQGTSFLNNAEVSNTNFKVENKIYQIDFNSLKKKVQKHNEEKNVTATQPSIEKETKRTSEVNNTKQMTPLVLENNNQNNNVQQTIFNRIAVNNKEDIHEKALLYAEIYKAMNINKGLGTTEVKKAYWDELAQKEEKRQAENVYFYNGNPKRNMEKNIADNSKTGEIVKVVPGSSFFAKLLIPIENIYASDVYPIAKIVSGPLKGYRLIGKAMPTTSNNGLILKFNKLVSPNGKEFSVNAVGVQTVNLSPKFVDSIDRHIFPKIVLTTLATVADTLFNRESGGEQYTAPAQSILSQELQEMANEYKTEIKVNPQYFVVIFY